MHFFDIGNQKRRSPFLIANPEKIQESIKCQKKKAETNTNDPQFIFSLFYFFFNQGNGSIIFGDIHISSYTVEGNNFKLPTLILS